VALCLGADFEVLIAAGFLTGFTTVVLPEVVLVVVALTVLFVIRLLLNTGAVLVAASAFAATRNSPVSTRVEINIFFI
jgi:hypothetical protein